MSVCMSLKYYYTFANIVKYFHIYEKAVIFHKYHCLIKNYLCAIVK